MATLIWEFKASIALSLLRIAIFYDRIVRYQRSIKKGREIKRAEMNNNTLDKKKLTKLAPFRTGFDKMFPRREEREGEGDVSILAA